MSLRGGPVDAYFCLPCPGAREHLHQRFVQRHNEYLTGCVSRRQWRYAERRVDPLLVHHEPALRTDAVILALDPFHRVLHHRFHTKIIVIGDRQRVAVNQRQPFCLLLLSAELTQIHHLRFGGQHNAALRKLCCIIELRVITCFVEVS